MQTNVKPGHLVYCNSDHPYWPAIVSSRKQTKEDLSKNGDRKAYHCVLIGHDHVEHEWCDAEKLVVCGYNDPMEKSLRTNVPPVVPPKVQQKREAARQQVVDLMKQYSGDHARLASYADRMLQEIEKKDGSGAIDGTTTPEFTRLSSTASGSSKVNPNITVTRSSRKADDTALLALPEAMARPYTRAVKSSTAGVKATKRIPKTIHSGVAGKKQRAKIQANPPVPSVVLKNESVSSDMKQDKVIQKLSHVGLKDMAGSSGLGRSKRRNASASSASVKAPGVASIGRTAKRVNPDAKKNGKSIASLKEDGPTLDRKGKRKFETFLKSMKFRMDVLLTKGNLTGFVLIRTPAALQHKYGKLVWFGTQDAIDEAKAAIIATKGDILN